MNRNDWNQLSWLAQQFASAEVTEKEISAIGQAPDGPILPAHTVSVNAVSDTWLDWSLVGVHNNEPVTQYTKSAGDGNISICCSYFDKRSYGRSTIIRPLVNVIATVPDHEIDRNTVQYVGHDHHRPYYWWQNTGKTAQRTDERTLIAYDQPVLMGKELRAFFINEEGCVICDESAWDGHRNVNRVFAFDPSTKKSTVLCSDCTHNQLVQTKIGLVGVLESKSGAMHVIEEGESRYYNVRSFDHVAFNTVHKVDEPIMMLTQLGSSVRQHEGRGRLGPEFTLPRRYSLGHIYTTFKHGGKARQFIEVKRPHGKVSVVVSSQINCKEEDLLPGAFDAVTAPHEDNGDWYYWAQSGRFLLKLKIPAP